MTSSLDAAYLKIQQWEGMRDEGAVENLIRSLTNEPSMEIRARAAQALGRWGDGRAGISLAVEGVGKGLKDEVVAVKTKCIESLGKLGSDRAVEHLIGVLQDRTLSGRMLAAEAGASGGANPPNPATLKQRSEAWDLQWSAAQALGNLASPLSVGALVGWGERLLLSEVRVLSADEKIELIRLALSNVFKKIDAGQIFDLSKNLLPKLTVFSWETSNDDPAKSSWAQMQRNNPVLALLQEELNRRKSDYMKTLDKHDTLFTPASAQPAPSNVKDTLFIPIQSAPAGSSASAAPDPSDLARLKAEQMNALSAKDSMFLPRHASSGNVPSRSASQTSSPPSVEEIERRAADYMKTLGNQDSLFMPIPDRTSMPSDPRESNLMFAEEPKHESPSPSPNTMSEEERRRKMTEYMRSLGKHDTLFQPIPSAVANPTPAMTDDDPFAADSPQDGGTNVVLPPPIIAPPQIPTSTQTEKHFRFRAPVASQKIKAEKPESTFGDLFRAPFDWIRRKLFSWSSKHKDTKTQSSTKKD